MRVFLILLWKIEDNEFSFGRVETKEVLLFTHLTVRGVTSCFRGCDHMHRQRVIQMRMLTGLVHRMAPGDPVMPRNQLRLQLGIQWNLVSPCLEVASVSYIPLWLAADMFCVHMIRDTKRLGWVWGYAS